MVVARAGLVLADARSVQLGRRCRGVRDSRARSKPAAAPAAVLRIDVSGIRRRSSVLHCHGGFRAKNASIVGVRVWK